MRPRSRRDSRFGVGQLSGTLKDASIKPTLSAFGNPLEQKDIVTQLKEDLERRQESYVRRERQYKTRIVELETMLSDARSNKSKENAIDASMDRVRAMHRTILESVGEVQDRTSKVLQEQEKDLLRAFRARLYSVQEELGSEKNKNDDGVSAWIEKSKQFETEVEWTKELAARLDRLNQSLTRENQRLKMEFSAQESDRDYLVKQLVMVKKENVSLRAEVTALQLQRQEFEHQEEPRRLCTTASTSSLPRVQSQSSWACTLAVRPKSAGIKTLTTVTQGDNRYKEIIKRLKGLLEVERCNLQHVRTAYKLELQNHTELKGILTDCIHDLQCEIAHVEQTDTLDRHFTASERQRLIEKLLEKKKVVTLLKDQAFPERIDEAIFLYDEKTKL